MKKILIASTLTLLLGSSLAFADQNRNELSSGGFNGPSKGVIKSVSEVLEASDDTPVELTGYVTLSLGNENYQFRDESGEVEIEIDDHVWRDLDINPETKVVVYGEVEDEHFSGREVEIERIRLAE